MLSPSDFNYYLDNDLYLTVKKSSDNVLFSEKTIRDENGTVLQGPVYIYSKTNFENFLIRERNDLIIVYFNDIVRVFKVIGHERKHKNMLDNKYEIMYESFSDCSEDDLSIQEPMDYVGETPFQILSYCFILLSILLVISNNIQ